MAFKIHSVLIATIVIFMIVIWQSEALSIKDKRDAPVTEKTATETLDELLNSLKTGVDDFAKTVQNNELIQNITAQVKQATESISKKIEELKTKN